MQTNRCVFWQELTGNVLFHTGTTEWRAYKNKFRNPLWKCKMVTIRGRNVTSMYLFQPNLWMLLSKFYDFGDPRQFIWKACTNTRVHVFGVSNPFSLSPIPRCANSCHGPLTHLSLRNLTLKTRKAAVRSRPSADMRQTRANSHRDTRRNSHIAPASGAGSESKSLQQNNMNSTWHAGDKQT